jgi:hypothetical protein
MASEKQINFINKLIERKGMHQSMPVINRVAGHTSLEELSSGRASVIINLLLEMDDFNEAAYHRAMQAGLNRYEQLVQWAKDNGVKGVRSRMKTVNLMKLIAAAGLTAPAELVR